MTVLTKNIRSFQAFDPLAPVFVTIVFVCRSLVAALCFSISHSLTQLGIIHLVHDVCINRLACTTKGFSGNYDCLRPKYMTLHDNVIITCASYTVLCHNFVSQYFTWYCLCHHQLLKPVMVANEWIPFILVIHEYSVRWLVISMQGQQCADESGHTSIYNPIRHIVTLIFFALLHSRSGAWWCSD